MKNEEQKEGITGKQKKIVFWGSLLILSMAFVFVWGKVLVTTKAFNEQMEGMVLGEDYYLEDIVITDKRVETGASDDAISENYFFYYQNGKAWEYHKRMQVPGKIYSEYAVGDSIEAYTTDHSRYSYYKYGILPEAEYRNNEIRKAVGALLGIAIVSLVLVDSLRRNRAND